jgi:RND family efflux transporter MFP subunit
MPWEKQKSILRSQLMKTDETVKKKPGNSGRLRWFVVGCIVVALAGAGIWLRSSKKNRQAAEADMSEQEKLAPVVVTRPVRRTFERVIVTQGNVEAKNISMVSPRIPGTIEKFFVDEGDSVIAGQTKLFQTDSVKLEQNVAINEHDLAVARCAQQQAQANLEKVSVDFEKAELDFKRFERLLQKEATTQDAYEQQRAGYKQLMASRKVAQAQVELAAERARQAEAALAIATKDLADTTVSAPISGKVTIRMAEPGEMGAPGQPVLRIEDANLVEVSAFLPADAYPVIKAGQTKMRIQVSGIDLGLRTISYRSPSINAKLRTFEVKCLLKNPPDGIAPGAMAMITVVLDSREGLGIPSVAIQQRSGQNVVFAVKDDIAHQVTVESGIEMDGWTEISGGQVNEETAVVTLGQYMIEEGTRVVVQKEGE